MISSHSSAIVVILDQTKLKKRTYKDIHRRFSQQTNNVSPCLLEGQLVHLPGQCAWGSR